MTNSIQGKPLTVRPEDVSERYDPDQIRALAETVEMLEAECYRLRQNVVIGGIEDSAGRKPHLILQAPNGTYYKVEPDNSGALVTTVVTITTRA